MHRDKIGGIEIAAREPFYGAPIQIQPDSLTQVFDATDVVRRKTLLVDRGFDLPVPPTAVVLLSGKDHRSIRTQPGELIVAPVGREQSGDARVVSLQN